MKSSSFFCIFLIVLFIFIFSEARKTTFHPPTPPSPSPSHAPTPQLSKFLASNISSSTPFPKFWEKCVGSGHALLSLRSDYRDHFQRVKSSLGFSGVRFHGIFDDDLSVYLPYDNGQGQNQTYSFYNIDQLYGWFVDNGVTPIVELSFMPAALARNASETVFHYQGITSPPKDYQAWANLVSSFISHLVDTFGLDEISKWSFECWNEPNCGFWSGTQAEYFTLYNYTAHAVKSVHPSLKVGGPATCQSQWIPEFLSYCQANNVPVDFVSTHEYPTDINPLERNRMRSVVNQTRAQIPKNLPLYYTEYNAGLGDPMYMDSTYTAAFLTSTIAQVQGLVDIFSFWEFSDIFEEFGMISIPFNVDVRYGLLNLYGIPKPSFHAFELLHNAGTLQIPVYPPVGNGSPLDCFILYDSNSKKVSIFLANFDVPTNPVPPTFSASIALPFAISNQNAFIMRVDPDHANPVAAWGKMGSPQYLNRDQVRYLNEVSKVVPEKIQFSVQGGNTVFDNVLVPANGLAVIECWV